jgi:hypothetical protein
MSDTNTRLFIVKHEPRRKRETAHLWAFVAVIEAYSMTEAKRKAVTLPGFEADPDYLQISAEPLQVGKAYNL